VTTTLRLLATDCPAVVPTPPVLAQRPAPAMSNDPDRRADRAPMVATIRELFQLTAPETGVREAPPEVIEALRRVLRHRFIPPQEAALAYMRTCPCPSAWVRLSRSPASSH
jgi:hypothetical protein